MSTVEGDEEIIQCLKHLIFTRVGEWFLNDNYGFRRSVIEQKLPNEREMTEAFYDVLYQEPRIKEIISIEYDFDKIKRTLKVFFKARTITDTELEGDLDVNLSRI
ncbi:hypothetical protein EVU96_24895 [Bacillus infantis]|uniref:hypothetical protein n=1 Tax=Bacillus infantis TaxID=324767 RepID=UPI00101D4B0A|nr:hypothetical protein [Bacillus infantis]RYI25206.1 hypothetical protein EVU96_24895 [Bacillus infantis]